MDEKVTLELIERDYNTALKVLADSKRKEESLRDKFLIEKFENALKILRLEAGDSKDTYALDMLNKVANAVAKSKSMRETAIVLDNILRDDNVKATTEIKSLHEVAGAILGKEDEIMALQRQVKRLKEQSQKKENSQQVMIITAMIVILVILVVFVFFLLKG